MNISNDSFIVILTSSSLNFICIRPGAACSPLPGSSGQGGSPAFCAPPVGVKIILK